MGSGQKSALIWLAALAGMVIALFAVDPGRRVAPPPAPACPANTEPMVRVELIFGMGRRGRPEISDEDWRDFLEQEVTPRFPDGLTVMAGQGQWRNPSGAIIRETSRTLLVLVRPSAEIDGYVDAIRTAWRQRYEQQSVLKAVAASCVSF